MTSLYKQQHPEIRFWGDKSSSANTMCSKDPIQASITLLRCSVDSVVQARRNTTDEQGKH
jgi:hypothetical protein